MADSFHEAIKQSFSTGDPNDRISVHYEFSNGFIVSGKVRRGDADSIFRDPATLEPIDDLKPVELAAVLLPPAKLNKFKVGPA